MSHQGLESLPFYGESAVRDALAWEPLFDVLERAMAAFSAGEVSQPVRQMVPVPGHDAIIAAMPAVGEAMAVGRTFKESFQKALRTLEVGHAGLEPQDVPEGEEGLRMARAVLEAQRRLDPSHPSRTRSELAVAAILRSMGRREEAIRHYRHVLETRQEALGPSNPNVAAAALQLARALNEVGDHDEAASLLALSRSIYERTYGEDHPYLADVHHDAGVADRGRGLPDRARAHFQLAVDNASANFPAGDPGFERSLAALSGD